MLASLWLSSIPDNSWFGDEQTPTFDRGFVAAADLDLCLLRRGQVLTKRRVATRESESAQSL